MRRCPRCSEEIRDDGAVCADCGAALDVPPARPGRSARLGLWALTLLGLGAGVLMLWRGGRGGCEPRDWVEWHLAMSRRCLDPAYVCEHMTASRLPESGETAGRWLTEMVERMRESYGCGPDSSPRAAPRALPFGHPPIPGTPSLGTFAEPSGRTL